MMGSAYLCKACPPSSLATAGVRFGVVRIGCVWSSLEQASMRHKLGTDLKFIAKNERSGL